MISFAQQKLTTYFKNKPDISHSFILYGLITVLSSMSFSAYAFSLSQTSIQFEQKQYGSEAVNRLFSWQKLINNHRQETELEKIRLVTDFFNAIPYHTDKEVWNQTDFWANPLEFIGKNTGDCEDYTIAKYLTLKAMGVSPDKLRMVYVVSKKLKAPHMILAYYETEDAQPLILDNMTPQILYAADRKDLRPVYMFSENAIWISPGNNAPPKEVVSGMQIHAWKLLMQRMQQQGLTEKGLMQ